jgi:L-fuculose-phosphate aldolase
MPTGDAHAARVRREIVAACRRLDARGLVAGTDGNVSVRIARDRILVTPSGVPKGSLRPKDIVEVDSEGTPARVRQTPSSELAMHLALYELRPDVGAVVHAHPPAATAFAVSGTRLPVDALAELTLELGQVPLVPYATPGSVAVAEAFAPFAGNAVAFLMAQHGATAIGTTLAVALRRMESLEQGARVLLGATLLGSIARIPPDEAAKLAARRSDGRDSARHVPSYVGRTERRRKE